MMDGLKRRDFSTVTRQLREAQPEGAAPDTRLGSLEQQVEAIARGDLEGFFAHAHDDLTFEIFAPHEFGFIGAARGVDAVRYAIEHNFGLVEGQRPVLTSIMQQGDTIVVFGRETGIHRSGGGAYVVEFVQKFTFREGRLASIRSIVARA